MTKKTNSFALTSKHLDEFKHAALYWQKFLGLHDWHLYIHLGGAVSGAFASTWANPCEKFATIRLSDKWFEHEPTYDQLQSIALHEVMHVAASGLRSEAMARYTIESDIDAEEHGLVVRMTNVLQSLHQAPAPPAE